MATSPKQKHQAFRIHSRANSWFSAEVDKWGYTKILGELKKLGIIKTSKSTIKNILKEYGIDPLKNRSDDTWDSFLKRTFHTLWACDFFTKSVWSLTGRKLFFVLFFINIKTRKINIAGITDQPNSIWIKEKLEESKTFFSNPEGNAALIRDRDAKFSKEFDQFFADRNINVLKIPFRSPNLNPYAESWVATVKRECLNHFIVLGKVHLEYLVNQFANYYNNFRPHSGKDNEPLTKQPIKVDGNIYTEEFLGGLINHYYRE